MFWLKAPPLFVMVWLFEAPLASQRTVPPTGIVTFCGLNESLRTATVLSAALASACGNSSRATASRPQFQENIAFTVHLLQIASLPYPSQTTQPTSLGQGTPCT